MTDDELIEDLAGKVNRGEITFDKVRPSLEEKGFDEQRVRLIVRKVDDEVQKALISGGGSTSMERVMPFGIALVAIGGVLALGSFAGLFSLNQFSIIITYGCLVAGLVIVVAGYRRKKGNNPNADSKTLNRSFRLRKDKTDEE